MKLSWKTVSHIGVDVATNPADIRYITLVNTLAVFIFFFEISYLPILIPNLSLSKILIAFLVIAGISNLFVPALNYYRLYLVARVVFGILALLLITVFSIFTGRDSLLHIFLLESIVIAFFIYPVRERAFRNGMVFLYATAYVGLEIWFLHHAALIDSVPEIVHYSIATGLLILSIAISYYTYTIIHRAETRLEEERAKSENLLLNILPLPIVLRLKSHSSRIVDRFNEATILFSDIVQFSRIVESTPADRVVDMLNDIFSEFDALLDKYGLEKIKTIGDAYMLAGGIPLPRVDHCEAVANMALDMQQLVQDKFTERPPHIKIRIGIDTGPVVAGIVGRRKYIYDLWGDSVNTASRMESHGTEGKIQVSQKVYDKLKEHYRLEFRGTIEIKGKGKMAAYYLLGRT